MKEITITIAMALRYVDKKIKILELISKHNSEVDGVSNIGLEITDYELTDIFEDLQHFGLLEIKNTDLISIPNESSHNEIVIHYKIVNKGKIAGLLKGMRDKYPRLEKPLISERPLKKIAKHFSGLETKNEIITLLENWGVPKILIKRQYTREKMILSIMNYPAASRRGISQDC